MKNIWMFLLLGCLTCAVSAQNVGGGIAVGLNASQIDGDNSGGFKKAGLTLGAFLHYELADKLLLQPEILYDQLGSADDLGILAKMDYITVPVLLNLSLPVSFGSNIQEIQFLAGPALGILITARDGINMDIKDGLKSTDLRATGGIAYRRKGISLSARYNYSILSIAKGGRTSLLFPLGGPYHNYMAFTLRLHMSN